MRTAVVLLLWCAWTTGVWAASAGSSAAPLNPGDALIGTWVSSDGEAHIQVTAVTGGTYSGTIIWLRRPNDDQGHPKVDTKNPDARLRSRPVIGLRILGDLHYVDGRWDLGWIYDPESGSTYHCHASLGATVDSLELRGFVGVSLFGRTETWTRLAAGGQ